METKKALKQTTVKKTTIEFMIIISIAVVFFSFLNSLGFFDKIYSLKSHPHSEIDRLLILGLFFAAAMAVFAIRRWLELRKAYNKLAQSDEKLRFQSELLDEIGDGITATDLKGKITYVNQTQCDWVNRNRNELIGQPVKMYDLDNSLDSVQKEIVKTTLEKEKWTGEIANITPDGNKITLECHTWLMKDSEGKPTGMCGVARNITEKKERQQELLKHKNYLEALDAAAGILLHSITEIKYEEFLSVLGEASGVDRVLVVLKKNEQKSGISMPIKAQWIRNKNVKAAKDNTENYFTENIWPKWEEILCRDEPICLMISDLTASEQESFNMLDIKALLALPITIDGNLEGFISFDNCTNYRQWTTSEIDFLHTAAKNLANAIKRLEIKKELKAQRDFAQRLIETAQTIVLVLDNDANIVTFNPYLEKLTGYSLEEVKGKNWFDTFLPQEDRQKINQEFQKAINGSSIEGYINPILTKNRELHQIEWFCKPLKDSWNKIIGILSTGQDITERSKAEEELKKSEAMLKSVVTAVPVGLGIASNRTIQWVNDSLLHLSGYQKEEIIGEDSRIFYENDEGYNLVGNKYYGEIREKGKSSIEVNWKHKNGKILNIILTGVALNKEDINEGIVFAVMDITERKGAEEELKKAHEELEQRVEQRTAELKKTNIQLLKTIEERDRIQKVLQETEKLAGAGKLAAQIAHEINNPLAGIKNSFLLVKDAIPSEHKYYEYVGRIEKEINRVSQIVKQMFDLYRPGTKPAKRFRLYDTIKDISELLLIARQEKHINIEIDCDEKITVTLPEALLRQVVFNLVQNAIQASGSDTTVRIIAFADDGRLKLSVSDQGHGIDEKIKDRIFEPFFTTGFGGPESGLGLGLAITKDIISAMNGEISFKSENDKGTIFNISIPVENESRIF